MTSYRETLNKLKGMRDIYRQQHQDAEKKILSLSQQIAELESAREVVNSVMVATQSTVKGFIEEVVSLALKTVFGDTYALKVAYEIKRNKPEASLMILKDGIEFDPTDEVGGGVIDVAALGLRMAMWALANPKPEPVLILDEPGKFVSRDLIEEFGKMIKICSEMLSLQIIMVSHDPAMIAVADRSFEVTQTNGVSKVNVV